jgi:hypothetical protein
MRKEIYMRFNTSRVMSNKFSVAFSRQVYVSLDTGMTISNFAFSLPRLFHINFFPHGTQRLCDVVLSNMHCRRRHLAVESSMHLQTQLIDFYFLLRCSKEDSSSCMISTRRMAQHGRHLAVESSMITPRHNCINWE